MIKIALCDDNEVERRLLRKIVTAVLQELHQEVLIVEFSSGEKLQRNFSRGDYDLIFLDVFMKEMDGIATGRAIRKKDVKVEIILATGSDQYLREGYELHAFAYLMKPYDVRYVQRYVITFREIRSVHMMKIWSFCVSAFSRRNSALNREKLV